MKNKIMAPDTDVGPWTLDEALEGKGKPVFTLETAESVFIANDMDTTLRLWAHRCGIIGDESITKEKVIALNRIG